MGDKKIYIAYEPVWAIANSGDGTPCLPSDAADVHEWIKQELEAYGLEKTPLLYGGSVNAENVVSYISLDSVDGVLVGGASSKYSDFSSLITSVGHM